MVYSIMQTTTEPTQRLNVDLPKSQYFALKAYALHNDVSVSQLVRTALQQVVDYDAWFRQRVEAAQADTSAPISEDDWSAVKAQKLALKQSLAKAQSPKAP